MKRSVSFVLTFFLFVNCSANTYTHNFQFFNPFALQDTSVTKRKVVITGVGDIMLGSSFPSERFLPPDNNPFLLLESVADTLSDSDITFGNLEGSFLNNGVAAKKCKDTTICYLFRMPENYVSALTSSGFDILSLANNHFGDFGLPARNRTKQILDSVGIFYGGLIEHPWSIFMKDSLLYGFCAFAPNAGTIDNCLFSWWS
jgi:hypothetical protein